MIYQASSIAIIVFLVFVGITLGISFYFGAKAKSSSGYFAAHGQIPWFINGVAFAGDYLSAASFLGICGMIAFYGYDGFLYSIGYLAGWIVALFIIAEPMKRLGKFTFADALDAKFGSPEIRLVAGISTLAVSIFYLIPQMVGAGALIQPLLGFPHWAGVVMVGTTVILIVVTAGMVSTTYVQFLKGFLLVFFASVLTWMLLARGFEVKSGGIDGYEFETMQPIANEVFDRNIQELAVSRESTVVPAEGPWASQPFVRIKPNDANKPMRIYRKEKTSIDIKTDFVDATILREAQIKTVKKDRSIVVNGQPLGTGPGQGQLHPVGFVNRLIDGNQSTGFQGPITFFRTLQGSEVTLWSETKIAETDGSASTVYWQRNVEGNNVLRPGEHPIFSGIRSAKITDRLNFLSLMLALFGGTASLPHILIRYYTVKDTSSARKSTIVGIATIGFFYILTLYLGIGAMTSGALDLTDTNMAAPLLARSMNEWLFAIISAIAFTTVLGTVSGLILASSGAVAHDLMKGYLGVNLSDHQQVRMAKIAAVVVGVLAIILGILFKELNVTYLVGWAFSVAASANLPALIMLLFWRGTTRQGIIAGVSVGMISSLAWILLSAETYTKVYGISADLSPMPFSQPGLVTIPLGFITLIVVSLLTKPRGSAAT